MPSCAKTWLCPQHSRCSHFCQFCFTFKESYNRIHNIFRAHTLCTQICAENCILVTLYFLHRIRVLQVCVLLSPVYALLSMQCCLCSAVYAVLRFLYCVNLS